MEATIAEARREKAACSRMMRDHEIPPFSSSCPCVVMVAAVRAPAPGISAVPEWHRPTRFKPPADLAFCGPPGVVISIP